MFIQSAEDYMEERFPRVSVNTFRNLGVPNYLPFGVPHTAEGKKELMIRIIQNQNTNGNI